MFLFSIKYFEEIKNWPTAPPPRAEPTADPNYVSKVHHVHSDEDFEIQLKNAGSKLIVIDFFATWCGPCRYISPILDGFADKYESQAVILKVDVDQLKALAKGRYRVNGMPTFVFLKDGETVERFSGAYEDRIEQTIQKYSN